MQLTSQQRRPALRLHQRSEKLKALHQRLTPTTHHLIPKAQPVAARTPTAVAH